MVPEGVGSAEQLTAGDKAGFEGVADRDGQLTGVDIARSSVEECPEGRGEAEPLASSEIVRRRTPRCSRTPLAVARKFGGTVR